MDINFKFRGEDLILRFFKYNGGRIGMLMIHKDSNQLWGSATLNVDSLSINSKEVIIRDYHNTQGIYNALLEAEIIMAKRRDYMVGINVAKICKLHPVILDKLRV